MGLSDCRKEIEKIDLEIISLIERRVQLADEVFHAKRLQGLEVSDPEQERVVINQAVNLAQKLNLDSDAVGAIFSILMQMNVRRQMELLDKERSF
jgi:chorismate mutase